MPKIKSPVISALIALVVVGVLAGAAGAHFHTYWPKTPGCYGKPGETAQWTYFWGHPFEMIVYDAQAPKFFVFTPQGKKESAAVKETALKDQESGKDRKAFQVEYQPAAPGDYYLCLEAAPYFIPEEKLFWLDFVKAPWHVMAEKGWDKKVGLEMEIVPLTRPYGWPAGSAFTGQALFKGKPLKEVTVEVEKFNGFFVSKDRLPKDRFGEENGPLVTRVLKTNVAGYFSCTLDSPGWWVISVSHEDGKKAHEGKQYPVEKRGCLWVYMEAPPPALAAPPK